MYVIYIYVYISPGVQIRRVMRMHVWSIYRCSPTLCSVLTLTVVQQVATGKHNFEKTCRLVQWIATCAFFYKQKGSSRRVPSSVFLSPFPVHVVNRQKVVSSSVVSPNLSLEERWCFPLKSPSLDEFFLQKNPWVVLHWSSKPQPPRPWNFWTTVGRRGPQQNRSAPAVSGWVSMEFFGPHRWLFDDTFFKHVLLYAYIYITYTCMYMYVVCQ